MNDSFVFYKSFYEAASELDGSDRLEFYDALTQYAITGEEPDIKSAVARAMFKMARPQIDANEKRREDGKKGAEFGKLGGRPKKENPIGVIDENPIGVIEKTPNVNVNANANVNAKDKKEGRMTRPTVEEVRSYCRERQYNVDADAFMAFYDSNGWKVGKNPMRDWKACVRTWESRKREHPPNIQAVKKNAFSSFSDRHEYDFDELERVLSRPVGGAL